MEDFSIIFLIIWLAVAILMIASVWKVFVKAEQPGWACIIPIYNIIVMLQIIGKPIWWVILFFIPVVNLVFMIWMLNLISKSFGQGVGFTIGLILLPIIFWPILGLGSAKYQGPSAKEAQETTSQ